MFKTDITYTNFLGTEVTETLRFNLTETELLDLIKDDPKFDTGFLAYVSQEKDYIKAMDMIRRLIVVSYGEVSDDGKYFRKSDERAIDFLQSAAYEAFKDKLLSDREGKLVVDFMLGILPEKFRKSLKDKLKADGSLPQLEVIK